tara:strand:- start:505 stop:1386 length:882 start_codon:yes stop_codon:yes gene_type:complete
MREVEFQNGIMRIDELDISNFHDLLFRQLTPKTTVLSKQSDDEESFYRAQSIGDTTSFERNRNRVRQSLKDVVRFIWEEYDLPREGIIEYGSGATGYFWAELKPEYVTDWLQVEINPNAIRENQRRNPRAPVIEGSYNDIPYRGVPMIVGLSSFDTTANLSLPIDQVASALKSGGYFLHIQDVRPGPWGVAQFAKRKYGEVPDEVLFLSDGSMVGFVIDGEKVPIVELFRQYLGEKVEQHPDLELTVNHYFSFEERLARPNTEFYCFNVYATAPSRSPGRRETTLITTLAKKV